MKKFLLVLLFLPVLAKAQLLYNFEQGTCDEWIQVPLSTWSADRLSPLSGGWSLHHIFDNPAEGTDVAVFPLNGLSPTAGNTRWRFTLRHGTDPSSSNNWGFIVMSDCSPEKIRQGGIMNGYAVGVNLSGYDDTLRIWRVNAGKFSVVATGKVNWQNSPGSTEKGFVQVERTPAGSWTLMFRLAESEEWNISTGFSPELFPAFYAGLLYRYTSSRDRLLWIDDVEVTGVFIKDTLAPSIVSVKPVGKNSADIFFDEPVSTDSLREANIYLNGKTSCAKVSILTDKKVRVSFGEPFQNKQENEINFKLICDASGNCGSAVSKKFTAAWPEAGDIIISEIMADPSPPVSLPAAEYLEIYNNSSFDFNLSGLSLVAGEQEYIMPEFIVPGRTYLVLCRSSDTALFRKYGTVKGLSPFPSLYDEGRMIVLTDTSGNLIHGVDYSKEWYGTSMKSEGGWSLEMIDAHYPFGSQNNWSAASDKSGGTPGRANSVAAVNADYFFGGIENLWPADSLSLVIYFTEPVSNAETELPGRKAGDVEIKEVRTVDRLRKVFRLTLAKAMDRNRIYNFNIPLSVTDYAGNRPDVTIFKTGLPEPAVTGSIVFNELLFNPLPGGSDFIEFTSLSPWPIDMSELFSASVNEGSSSAPAPVSDVPRLLMPGEYFVIADSPDDIVEKYPANNSHTIFRNSKMPSMPDDCGQLLLVDRHLTVIDEVSYNSSMHSPLLSSSEGVSLEKVRPDLTSEDISAWHTASGVKGWGTPGLANSMLVTERMTDELFNFSSLRISPDGDGFEDILIIELNTGSEATVVSASVFSETGAFVSKIIPSLLASGNDKIIWDGTGQSGELLQRGIYVILVTAFDRNGKVMKAKKAVTVIR